ncbi:coiled-coil domain-containing protein 9-like [Cucumis melo var. makuwa]|uniref:Coiled-coil domain-containing protein 9-like n=1 Tax=Cucumis melo var. makuwa TaxID=1194695 RepID=A0A5D3BLF1_CUCMM|nr:coiled-coil domain-containing protein 9-like [Cucumis melo var. makuwa]
MRVREFDNFINRKDNLAEETVTSWCGEKIRGGPVSIYSCGGYFILVESATSRFSKTRAVTSRKRKFMASISLFSSKTLVSPSATYLRISSSSSTSHSCCLGGCRCSFPIKPLSTSNLIFGRRRTGRQVVRMAPEEEKLTRRNPLDFPIEWERPRPGRRPDIFPQFSPMKTPLPPPLPCDPPEEDEEEEEKKEEEEENPDKENPEGPEQQ